MTSLRLRAVDPLDLSVIAMVGMILLIGYTIVRRLTRKPSPAETHRGSDDNGSRRAEKHLPIGRIHR